LGALSFYSEMRFASSIIILKKKGEWGEKEEYN
jgi:hypothetical protein